jgi:hypothetical protein
MKQTACFVLQLLILGCSLVSAQNAEKVDSLLAAHRYTEALVLIDAAPVGSLEDARVVVNHLQALPNLTDSLFNARVINALTVPGDYADSNAGTLSASLYADMRALHASQKYASAYEQCVLARYFRTKHVRQELDRLRDNVSRTSREVKEGQFKEAEALFGVYQNERRTSAFQILEDSLARAYRWLKPQIEDGLAKRAAESSWVSIARSMYVTGGAGLNPNVSLDKTQLLLREFDTKPYQVWSVPENAIKTVPILYCFEGGCYLSSRTSIGISLARWKSTFRIAIKNLYATNFASYRASVEYTRADAFLKYRFTDKTGPRPYLTAGVGAAACALTSLDDSGAEHTLYVQGSNDTVFRILLGGGAEYVFSPSSPFMVSWNALLFLNSANTDILNRVNLETTLQLGVIL